MRCIYRSCLLFVIASCLVPALSAFAEDMPPTMAAYFGLAPGCSVDSAMAMPGVEVCTLACPGQSPSGVTEFYLAKLSGNGFVIQHKAQYPGGMMTIAGLNDSTASIDASQDNGSTLVSLSLDNVQNLDTLAAPVPQPQAAQSAPQPATQSSSEPAEKSASSNGAGNGYPMLPWGSGQAGATQATAASGTADDDDTGTQAQEASGSLEVSGSGVSAELWEQVTPMSGDKVMEEFISNGTPCADMMSDSNTRTVLEFYRDQMVGKGWQQITLFMESDGGMLQMFRGDETFQVFAEGADSGSGTEYMLTYSKG